MVGLIQRPDSLMLAMKQRIGKSIKASETDNQWNKRRLYRTRKEMVTRYSSANPYILNSSINTLLQRGVVLVKVTKSKQDSTLMYEPIISKEEEARVQSRGLIDGTNYGYIFAHDSQLADSIPLNYSQEQLGKFH
jgi:hypothetical protein